MKNILNERILAELPVMFQFTTIKERDFSNVINIAKSDFYQSDLSVCFNPSKPISKILVIDE